MPTEAPGDTSSADVEGRTPEGSPAASPSTPRKLAPIPPSKSAKGAGPERNADGTFAKGGAAPGATGEREDDGGLPDILQLSDDGIDDYDRAKTSLDGSPPESSIKPRITQKVRARDVLAPKPEVAAGVEGSGTSPEPIVPSTTAPADAVALGPDGKPIEPASSEDPADLEPITLAGTTYRNRAHLEQSVRSLQGMYNSEVKRSAQREHTSRQNYEAAMAWKAIAEQGRAPSSEGTGGVAGATPGGAGTGDANASAIAKTAAATGATEESVLKSIDWKTYNAIKTSHDAETALVWAMEQMETKLRAQIQARYDTRLDEMTRPAAEAQALAEEGGAIGVQMDAMARWTYDNTTDAVYPELADADAFAEIGQVVVAMHNKGVPLAFFKTPEGINQAVLTWRDWRARNNRPWSRAAVTSPSAPAANAATDTHAAAAASVRAAASAGTLIGRSAPVRPAPADAGRGADIVRSITESAKPSEFGWAR